jgi:Xaa-Pro aminopeptidase
VFDYEVRRSRLAERLDAAGVDALFLGPSSDLEYLTGIDRGIPTFGQSAHNNGWVAGAFFRGRGGEPVVVLPRMRLLEGEVDPPGEMIVVSETDDGAAVMERLVRGLGPIETLAIGDRVWAEAVLELARIVGADRLRTGSQIVNDLRRVKDAQELETMQRAARVCDDTFRAVAPKVQPGVTMAELVEEVEHHMRLLGSRVPSFTTHAFTFYVGGLNSNEETRHEPLPEGRAVMFDYGSVVDGYCSDFGRTVSVGEPPAEVVQAYELVLAAQEAGRAALRPGVLAREVNAACRGPIEEAGMGRYFRHRMGHGIGMDVHERPFVSEEDETPLEAGMTFTDEPSILVDDDGLWGVRIEDVVVCEPAGGRKLNALGPELVVNR